MTLPFFDPPPQRVAEEEVKKKPLSPFDFVNAIHFSKANLIVDAETEKAYNPYIVNKALGFGADTVFAANEMNQRYGMPKKAQFSFLINIVRPRKRYNKWLKAEKDENIEMVKQYYRCNTKKALDAMSLLTPQQLEIIKQHTARGGNGKSDK